MMSNSRIISKNPLKNQPWVRDTEIFKNFVDNVPVMIAVYSSTRFIYVNSTFTKILGYSLQEAQKMNFWDVVHPDHREMAKTRGLDRMRGKAAPVNYEFKVLKKNGETIWLNLFFAVTHLATENIAISSSVDITESKRLKEQLQVAHDELETRVKQRTEELNRINQELIYTNQNLNNILKNMSYGVVTVNHSGEFDIINSIFHPSSEKTLSEIKSQLKDLFVQGRIVFINRMFEANEPFRDYEIKLHTSDGPLCLLASGTPILNEEGIVNRGVIMLRPIKEVHGLVNRYSGFRASFHFEDIITNDATMLDLIQHARHAAKSTSNVLIYGESGTGKELFAQSIHNESPRARGPFLAVNCGAIPRELIGSELFGYAEGAFTSARKGGNPGKFELANGGTIFLDEIGDLPFEQQAAILRVVQEKSIMRIGGRELIPVDVRIVCATNKDLSVEMGKGSFRHDLYYRLNIISIRIPPLRERPCDIVLLLDHFLKIGGPQFKKSVKNVCDDALDCLTKYEWPGNVRELQNVVERVLNVMDGSSLEFHHLPPEIKRSGSVFEARGSHEKMQSRSLTIKEAMRLSSRILAESEKKQIMELFEKHRGNISRIAVELGISRTTLYRKISNYTIS